MESHKNQQSFDPLLIRSFHDIFVLFLRIMVNNSNHRYISESIDISQSISINQFDAIEASNLIGGFFCFPIIQHNLIFSTHAGRAGHLNK